MRKTSNWVRIALISALTLLFLAHASGAFRLQFIDSLERSAYDLRVRMTAPGGQDARIIIADIDEKSLQEVGHWPWSRDVLARMIDTLFDHYQVRSLGFDVLFAEADKDTGLLELEKLANNQLKNNRSFQRQYQRIKPQLDFDQQFAESLKDRPVVMGFVFNQADNQRLNILPEPVSILPEPYRNRLLLYRPKGYSGNIAQLQQDNVGGFFDNPALDRDGIFRRVPLLQEVDGQLYGSLALNTLRVALGNPELKLPVQAAGALSIKSIGMGKYQIPLGPHATALVPYRGPERSFPYISIADILNKSVPVNSLKGKIILVGSSAPGLQDLRTTPLDNTYPGVEVHANLIAGILDDRIIRESEFSVLYELFILLVLAVVAGYATSKLPPIPSFVAIALLTGGTLWLNLAAWDSGSLQPIASSLVLLAAIFMLQTFWGFFMESRDKKVLHGLFGQYVPPELVDEMADAPDKVSVEGESRNMTVLFSDVRGFTTISEGLEPKVLASLMNEMLTPMTQIIHANRGTIDKYMGDAIMAFWGAPLADPLHARHAIDAAMRIVNALPEINRVFAEKGWPEINVGVGLNTGSMSVGNMGSEFRMAYTVLGDAVNLGSRLEGLTKQYGVQIIVSEFTMDEVPEYAYRELDCVRVKGKDKPVRIFEPLGLEQELDEHTLSLLKQYQHALACYRQQNWIGAKVTLEELQQQDPNRMIYQVYLDRIEVFMEHPPEKDWDGVFTHTSK